MSLKYLLNATSTMQDTFKQKEAYDELSVDGRDEKVDTLEEEERTEMEDQIEATGATGDLIGPILDVRLKRSADLIVPILDVRLKRSADPQHW